MPWCERGPRPHKGRYLVAAGLPGYTPCYLAGACREHVDSIRKEAKRVTGCSANVTESDPESEPNLFDDEEE